MLRIVLDESADAEASRMFATTEARVLPVAVGEGVEVKLSVEQAQRVLCELWAMLPENKRPMPHIPRGW